MWPHNRPLVPRGEEGEEWHLTFNIGITGYMWPHDWPQVPEGWGGGQGGGGDISPLISASLGTCDHTTDPRSLKDGEEGGGHLTFDIGITGYVWPHDWPQVLEGWGGVTSHLWYRHHWVHGTTRLTPSPWGVERKVGGGGGGGGRHLTFDIGITG